MTAGSLTSNHVNYLVWRYLQESGYGESAVKLQRDWREDPQDLPFAQYIKTHALVTLIQKGLRYHEIEHSLDEAPDACYFLGLQQGRPIQRSEAVYFFGPGSGAPVSVSPNHAVDEVHPEQPSPSKNGRALTAAANGTALDYAAANSLHSRHEIGNNAEHDVDAMDIDSQQGRQNGGHGTRPKVESRAPSPEVPLGQLHRQGLQASPPPQLQPQPPTAEAPTFSVQLQAQAQARAQPSLGFTTPLAQAELQQIDPIVKISTSVHGSSAGTQVEKIPELASHTVTLDIEGRSALSLAWNPTDATSLAAAGTEALARIWTAPSNRANNQNNTSHKDGDDDGTSKDHYSANNNVAVHAKDRPSVNGRANGSANGVDIEANSLSLPRAINLQEDEHASMLASALCWSPDGNYLAIGFCDEREAYDGHVIIWTKDGTFVSMLPTGQDTIMSLRWSPSGSHLLGICTTDEGSKIVIWEPLSAEGLDCVTAKASLEDASWLHDSSFVVVGASSLNIYRFDGHANLLHVFDSPGRNHFRFVRPDAATGTIATATHESIIDIWESRGHLHSIDASTFGITALEWQPLPSTSRHVPFNPRFLACSCQDGFVRIWNGSEPYGLIHALPFGAALLPVSTLSFSPDGFALAAATTAAEAKILVWNAQSGGTPLATWAGSRPGGARQPVTGTGVKSEEGAIEEHILSWDADGRRLAYGAGPRVSMITFR
ncbi:MAG: hypothetical protein M1825_001170 [Sarcosagium campestre]|nr:MAG: hypothetical protein M1825_001170 [Sarcosagium campestre]